MMVSPVVVVPKKILVLFSHPIYFFRISEDVSWHWPLTLLRHRERLDQWKGMEVGRLR